MKHIQEVHVEIKCELSNEFYVRMIWLFHIQYSPFLPSSHGGKKVHPIPHEFMTPNIRSASSPRAQHGTSGGLFFPWPGGIPAGGRGHLEAHAFFPYGKNKRPLSHVARLLLRLLCRRCSLDGVFETWALPSAF